MNNLHPDRNRLDEASRWMHPYLVYESSCSDDGFIDSQGRNLDTLYAAVRAAYPRAGKRYWTVRTWTLVYWQLVYLSIGCVYRLKLPIDIYRVAQHIKGSSVYGYHLKPAGNIVWKDEPFDEVGLIEHSGENLRVGLESLYRQSTRVFTLNHSQAFRLVAATVVSVLVLYQEKKQREDMSTAALNREESNHQNLRSMVSCWLQATGLFGEADISTDTNPVEPIRKACCNHHLVAPNDICSNCPRIRKLKMNNINGY